MRTNNALGRLVDAEFGNRYLAEGSTSFELFQRASRVMPGGNSRTTVFSPPYPYYVRSGTGCRVLDVEGQERVDFLNNYTSLLHGHADARIGEATKRQLDAGVSFSAPSESEIRLAEIITKRMPTIERVRFTNSGSEAVMMAIQAARAYSGRSAIAKFEGSYHGSYDVAAVSVNPGADVAGEPDQPNGVPSSHGVSSAIVDETVVLPFNDLSAVKTILSRHKDALAAVLVDPLPQRSAFPQPAPGFLPGLRSITRDLGILLISDEIITVRVSYGGAQPFYGFTADLTTLGKIIGGGFPVGAVGGSAEIMAVFDPTGGTPKAAHYGTFNANPVTMVAGATALEMFDEREHNRVAELGAMVRARLRAVFAGNGVPAQVTGESSLFRVIFKTREIRGYRDSILDPREARLTSEFYLRMLGNGVILAPNGLGCISTPMSEREVEQLGTAVDRTIRSIDWST